METNGINSSYDFAQLSDEEISDIKEFEEKLCEDADKKLILIAYESKE